MALAGVKLETLVSEPDALTTRPPPCIIDNGDSRLRTRNALDLFHIQQFSKCDELTI